MQNGLYRVRFSGPFGQGHGVIFINDGNYYGGDSLLAYTGTIQQTGGNYTVTLKTMRHSPGAGHSVLGADDVNVTLTGHSTAPDEATLSVQLASGQEFRADIQKLPL